MSLIVKSLNWDTETVLAEFDLTPGGGIHAIYHSDDFRQTAERDGFLLPGVGVKHIDDGQEFLDALQAEYANSTRMVVVKTDGGAGRKDAYDPDKAAAPDPNTAPKPFVQGEDSADAEQRGSAPGLQGTEPGEVVPAPARKKKKPEAAPPPPSPMHSDEDAKAKYEAAVQGNLKRRRRGR